MPKKTNNSISGVIQRRVKKTAAKILDYKRKLKSFRIIKKKKVSSTGVLKAIQALNFKAGAAAEYKLLDQQHNTTGNPDAATRYFYRLTSSALESTESSTSTPGTSGYLLRAISHPTQGDAVNNRDGMRYGVASIQWKGIISLLNAANQQTTNGSVRLMLVAHLRPEDTFAINNFLQVDHNGEYSVMSRREEDHYQDFRVVASRTYKLNSGSNTKANFNIIARPNKIVKILSSGSKNVTYYCVAVCSADVSTNVTQIDYNGYTRLRFIN